jgi:hypothetical protein
MGVTKYGKKDKVRGTTRYENQHDAPRRSNRESGCLGNQVEHEPLGVDNQDWIGQISLESQFGDIGGILTQLIEEASDQLEECVQDISDARSRVERYELKAKKIQARLKVLQDALKQWQVKVVETAVIE